MLGNLWEVAASVRGSKTSIGCNKGYYSYYLCLLGSYNNGLWPLLLNFQWLIAKIACLFLLASSLSSISSTLFFLEELN